MDAQDQLATTQDHLLGGLVITAETSDDAARALHELAAAELEFVFAAREREATDLVLVARTGGNAVGFIAAGDADGRTVLWEHLVVPDYHHRGIGRALLHHLALGLAASDVIVIDPIGTYDPERLADYYRACGFGLDPATGQMQGRAGVVAEAVAPPSPALPHGS